MRRAAIVLLLAAGSASGYEDWNVEPRTASCTAGHFKSLEVVLPNILLREMSRIPSKEGTQAARYLATRPQVALRVSFVEKELAARFERPWEPNSAVLMAFLRGRKEFTIAHRVLHLNGQ